MPGRSSGELKLVILEASGKVRSVNLYASGLISRCFRKKHAFARGRSILEQLCVFVVAWGGMIGGVAQETQAPKILTEPKSLMIGAGFMTVMSMKADSGTYQWFQNDVLVARGTNSSISFNPAKLSDGGLYYCVVSNSAGSTTSKVARLTVTPRVELRSVSSTPLQNAARKIQAVGNLLYAADGSLQVFDVSNKASPQKIGTYTNSNGAIYSMFIEGKMAYCPVAKTGIQIVDMSDPSQPVARGTISFTNIFHEMVVRNGVAYVGCGELRIYDARDAANPELLGSYEGDTGWSVALAETEDVLYSVGAHTNVQVYDVSNPRTPTLISTLTQGSAGVSVRNGRLYTIPQLSIHDLSRPKTPRLMSSEAMSSLDIKTVGESDFVVSLLGGNVWALWDASIAGEEFAAGRLELPGVIRQVEWKDGFLYATWDKNLEIMEVSPASVPPVVTRPLTNSLAGAGTSVRLEAAAGGGEPLKWQWYKDDTALMNATNRVLWIADLSLEDEGEYSAVAMNSAGATTAGKASLSLIQPGTFSASITPRFSPGPRVITLLPEGLHATIEGSGDMDNWEAIWSGQASNEALQFYDYWGYQAPFRFYRLRYGN